METTPTPKWNAPIYQAACEWFVEFRSGEPDESARRAFHAWLQSSPAHMAAYLEVAALWGESGAVEVRSRWPVEELIQQGRADTSNVFPFQQVAEPLPAVLPQVSPGKKRAWVRLAAVAASILLLVTAGTLAALVVYQRDSYATVTGEQRSITLSDGSTVQLNARSKLHIHFTAQRRDVELLEGQALFQVAKDPRRVFVVSANTTQIRAVGTEFDVNRHRIGTTVTVLKGAVVVKSDVHTAADGEGTPDSPGASLSASHESREIRSHRTGEVLLAAGEQLTVTPTASAKSAHPNVAAATAWAQHQMIFETTSLAEVVEEFNRYNRRQIVIRDPRLEGFQIDGVFSSTDPSSLISFLRTRRGIQVTETESEVSIAEE